MNAFQFGHSLDHAMADARSRRGIDSANVAAVNTRMQEFEDRIERLSMVSEAMWVLLKKQTKLSDADLMAEITAIDLQDGQLNGRVKRTAVKCKGCGRLNARRHQACLYCTMPLEGDPFA